MICPRCQTNCNDNVMYCSCCGNKLQSNSKIDDDVTQYINSASLNSNDDDVTEYIQSNKPSNNYDDDATEYLDPSTSLIEQNNSNTVLLNNTNNRDLSENNPIKENLDVSNNNNKSKVPIVLGSILGVLVIVLILVILFL